MIKATLAFKLTLIIKKYLKKRKKPNYVQERALRKYKCIPGGCNSDNTRVNSRSFWRNVFMNHLDEKVISLKLKQMAANALH